MASEGSPRMKVGWLYNLNPTSCNLEVGSGFSNGSEEIEDLKAVKSSESSSALRLYFQDFDGKLFSVIYPFSPYFIISTVDGYERVVEIGLWKEFGQALIRDIELIEKDNIDSGDYLNGKVSIFLKITFRNVQHLSTVRQNLENIVKRNALIRADNPLVKSYNFFSTSESGMQTSGYVYGLDTNNTSLPYPLEDLNSDVNESVNRGINIGNNVVFNDNESWMGWVSNIYEYDIPYNVRVAIDDSIHIGLWYTITIIDGQVSLHPCDDSLYAPPMPRICAWDIETTKSPLKFPQPEVDEIYMLSYILDSKGFLIVNRAIVTKDIYPFEYIPKPEYEGKFKIFNEIDEKGLIRRFFDEMQRHDPQIYVTYNGDYFDFPFLHARALFHGMNLRKELGFALNPESHMLSHEKIHLDCFYWVKRDSYLPQGSQGLKAVTRAKLGYDPIEVDPEEMLPLAQNEPQKMASYSVSDAVSTWYLYLKYVHPFIFSLCTIIPMPPDEILRKGSGTLCESLLMVQAFKKNVLFPLKQASKLEKYYKGHLIDSETYIGGRVEALCSGIYRNDIPLHFNMIPAAFQQLIDNLDSMLSFSVVEEAGMELEDLTNYESIRDEIKKLLENLRDNPNRLEEPLIYHLDVGAMYPNIILTNRLQPYAIPTPEKCAGCRFFTPNDQNQCQRSLKWIWKGEVFTGGRYECQRIKDQLESECFEDSVIEKVKHSTLEKQTYGTRRGNVLEGTLYEKKSMFADKKVKSTSGKNEYRRTDKKDIIENENFNESGNSGDEEDDELGIKSAKAYYKLDEKTRFSMLKKRLGEYSRKAYGKIHKTHEVMRTNVVCQRENSFYVDTVRLFRDRRYEYKKLLKFWKEKLKSARISSEIREAQSRCVQMESLQLAHKCILNSFYGYVMRKGSRWGSMEMAGMVTHIGATIIQVARSLVQQIGIPLELDTDGIWCCFPKSFPENFNFLTKSGKSVPISFPCTMLNQTVNTLYSNDQYQTFDPSRNEYTIHRECSILFEIDGPYLAMFLPASREEGKTIKKRYAVFHLNGELAELKGFELKRRGELMLVKDFQAVVFSEFLKGNTLIDAYEAAAIVANRSMSFLYSHGEGYDDEEILAKLSESCCLSRRLSEYPEAQKSLGITCAHRIAAFLGEKMVKDKGLTCEYIISRFPSEKSVTERPIPISIFRSSPDVRFFFLRQWTKESSLSSISSLRELLDWDYYINRFSACVQKIITIPAALQKIKNPVPLVKYPDWVEKYISAHQSFHRQLSLENMGIHTTQNFANSLPYSHAISNDSLKLYSMAPILDLESLVKKKNPECTSNLISNDNESTLGFDDETCDSIHTDRSDADQFEEFSIRYFTPCSTHLLDETFFSHQTFSTWLTRQKRQWRYRRDLRKRIVPQLSEAQLASNLDSDRHSHLKNTMPNQSEPIADGKLTSLLEAQRVDLISKLLTTSWEILEIRQNATDDRNAIQIFGLIERRPFMIWCRVEKTAIIDQDPHSPPISYAKRLGLRVLPRHESSHSLWEVMLSSGPENDGSAFLRELRDEREDIYAIWESNYSPMWRLAERAGCVVTINNKHYIEKTFSRSYIGKDWLHFDDFNPFDEGTCSYYLNVTDEELLSRVIYIYQVGHDTRGLLVLCFPGNTEVSHLSAPSFAHIFIIQPSTAAPITVPWSAILDEVLAESNQEFGYEPLREHLRKNGLKEHIHYAVDMKRAWRMASSILQDVFHHGTHPPWFLASQRSIQSSEHEKNTMSGYYNLGFNRSERDILGVGENFLASELPPTAIIQLNSVEEDETLISDAFRWVRLLWKRILQRFITFFVWIIERRNMARLTGIPIGNIIQDSAIMGWDMLYIRALHRRSHILWNRYAYSFEPISERPRQMVCPGGVQTWSIEFSLAQIDVVSVLFSQLIDEDHVDQANSLCDNGVMSHFHVLRDLLSDVMNHAVNKSEAAVQILVVFARWIRCTEALCYEPRLVELVSHYVHRTLGALLCRIEKLGGKAIFVNIQGRLLVVTSKYMLLEAVHFSSFLISSLQAHSMLHYLALQPIRFYCPMIILDLYNYSGLFITYESAMTHVHQDGIPSSLISHIDNEQSMGENPSVELVQIDSSFTIVSALPHQIQIGFAYHIEGVLKSLYAAIQKTIISTSCNNHLSFSVHREKIIFSIEKNLLIALENYLPSQILEYVQWILDQNEQSHSVAEYSEIKNQENQKIASNSGISSLNSSTLNSKKTDKNWLAAEYIRSLSHVLSFFAGSIERVMAVTKSNCLRLCGIGPFSREADFIPNFRHQLSRIASYCSLCNEGVIFNLCEKVTNEGLACPVCHTLVSKNILEMDLVRRITIRLRLEHQRDNICEKCGEVSSTIMAQNCCGLLVPVKTNAQEELRLLLYIADIHNFELLKKSLKYASLYTL